MLRDAFNIWSVTDMGYAFLLQKCLFPEKWKRRISENRMYSCCLYIV